MVMSKKRLLGNTCLFATLRITSPSCTPHLHLKTNLVLCVAANSLVNNMFDHMHCAELC